MTDLLLVVFVKLRTSFTISLVRAHFLYICATFSHMLIRNLSLWQ